MPPLDTQVLYEWDIETVDNYGDIQDHYHGDTLYGLLKPLERWEATEGESCRLVLVRDVWDTCSEGLKDRQWWYPFDTTLSTRECLRCELPYFEDVAVPEKYCKEFLKYEDQFRQLLIKLNNVTRVVSDDVNCPL